MTSMLIQPRITKHIVHVIYTHSQSLSFFYDVWKIWVEKNKMWDVGGDTCDSYKMMLDSYFCETLTW